MSDPSPRKLPEHLRHLVPKRADFSSQADYEEAMTRFRHWASQAAQPSRSRASPGG
jgi:hypothetical protein